MRLRFYLKYGISLSLTATCLLALAAATEVVNDLSASIERFDLEIETGTYRRHVEPRNSNISNIKKRSPSLSSKHDFFVRTHHQSYNVQAAGRLLVGISSSFSPTSTASLSAALPSQPSYVLANGPGATVPLAPPTVTTALTNSSGTNVITSLTSELEVRLKCNIDANYCAKVANAFGSAIIQLGQVLRVKNRIV
jgi:hypothetical protein